MDLGVGGEVVAARKGALARLAHIGPAARVLAHVARQLVRARKLPVAALPAAGKRPLARVDARVRLEVRALGVALAAARVLAHIRLVLVGAATATLAGRAGPGRVV